MTQIITEKTWTSQRKKNGFDKTMERVRRKQFQPLAHASFSCLLFRDLRVLRGENRLSEFVPIRFIRGCLALPVRPQRRVVEMRDGIETVERESIIGVKEFRERTVADAPVQFERFGVGNA